MRKILLGEAENKRSTNRDNFINVELSSNVQQMPYTEDSYTVDAYEQYFTEKDASTKYRLAFTISPVCSNVLFNVITEPVYKEGSSACTVFLLTKATGGTEADDFPTEFKKYFANTIGRGSTGIPQSREILIKDTGYSHPELSESGLTYHCGYSIFNNHYLRKKEFVNICPLSSSVTADTQFNTIGDYIRRFDGTIVKDNILLQVSNRINNTETPMHVYTLDTIYSYFDSISYNLDEINGWLGFRNKANLPVVNYESFKIHKCLNDKNTNEYIDMYPDRTLYSFVPKYNKYRGRFERNWDYCITYPQSADYENSLVGKTVSGKRINGLECIIKTNLEDVPLTEMPSTILFKSYVRHNLLAGDYITMTFINGNNVKKTEKIRVASVGKTDGDVEHYFSVNMKDVFSILAENTSMAPVSSSDIGYLSDITESVVTGEITGINTYFSGGIRFRKYEDGEECQYYLRKFAKVLSYKTGDHVGNLDSSLNKLAFSQNPYSDQNAQIVFTEDINTEGLFDNLGRPVSELYLTIVKRNAGHEKWYTDNSFTDEDIEFSHCFGKVSSGFDLPEDEGCKSFNVHRLHNVNLTKVSDTNIPSAASSIESNITIGDDNTTFYGDIVEFLPSKIREIPIEPIYHRFNTAQRETTNAQYSAFTYDEIILDDYDGVNSFKVANYTANTELQQVKYINVLPEGYYYKPHYLIRVKAFKEEVSEGSHIKVGIKSAVRENGNVWNVVTDKNYYFQPPCEGFDGSLVYVYQKTSGEEYALKTSGYCIDVSGANFVNVKLELTNSTDINDNCIIFRHNTEMPEYAYDLQDGSGRYVWRDVLPSNEMPTDNELYDAQFTNGAHYFHKNINFYLKRQDPDGKYGLGVVPSKLATFLIENKGKDVTYAEYKKEGENSIC